MDSLILQNLLKNSQYTKKVLCHLKPDYFENYSDRIIFKIIKNFINKYSVNKLPNATNLKLILSKSNKITEEQFTATVEKINEIDGLEFEDHDLAWLVDETEDFCKSKAMENAIVKSVDLLQEGDKQLNKIEDLVRNALKVSFNSDLGIEFFNEDHIKDRFDKYNLKEQKYPCKIKDLNIAFNGGFEKKALTLILGGTHSGKCISWRSTVNIRNKTTGKVENITIEDLKKRCKQ